MTSKLFNFALLSSMLLAGCEASKSSTATSRSAQNTESGQKEEGIDSLSQEDQALARAQKYCAVTGEPLGSMGVPIKLMIEDQPVFICCEGCEEPARDDPKATLASVEELKTKAAAEATK